MQFRYWITLRPIDANCNEATTQNERFHITSPMVRSAAPVLVLAGPMQKPNQGLAGQAHEGGPGSNSTDPSYSFLNLMATYHLCALRLGHPQNSWCPDYLFSTGLHMLPPTRSPQQKGTLNSAKMLMFKTTKRDPSNRRAPERLNPNSKDWLVSCWFPFKPT